MEPGGNARQERAKVAVDQEKEHATPSAGEEIARRTEPSAKPVFAAFKRLRRLFGYYWKPLVTLGGAVPATLKILHSLGLRVTEWPERTDPTTQAVVIGLGIAVLVVIRFPKVAYRITRWVVGPPDPRPDPPRVFIGIRPYQNKDSASFLGRKADADACGDLIHQKPFFILEGESGCGKTSLLNVDLLPRARKKYHVFECRCSEDPFGKLRSSLLGKPYKKGRNYGASALNEAIEAALQKRGDADQRPILVCIDQFEELFVTVKDEVRHDFVKALKESMEKGKLRLLLAIRNDFIDLLIAACHDVDPEEKALTFHRENYYLLRTLTARAGHERRVASARLGRAPRRRSAPAIRIERVRGGAGRGTLAVPF